MELEGLVTGTKWDIIRIISDKPSSPMEIAKKLGTTIANISQQMRLLQTAGIVKKQRTGTGKPGKPRMLFSLSDNYALITVISKGFAKRKMVKISGKDKEVLKRLMKE